MSGMTIKQALAVIQTEVNYHAGSDTHYRAEKLEQSLTTLRAEIERLEKDAERYRWLRDPCSGAERVIFYCRGDYGRGLMSSAMLDAAIDEAMGKEVSND